MRTSESEIEDGELGRITESQAHAIDLDAARRGAECFKGWTQGAERTKVSARGFGIQESCFGMQVEVRIELRLTSEVQNSC